MSFQHTNTFQLTGSSGVVLKASKTEVGAVGVSQSKSFAASLTDNLWSVSFSSTNLQSLFMLADKDCTVKTNSAGSPANTFNLKAGIPLVWGASDGYFTKPTSADVTALYVTTGTSATLLKVEALTN